MYSSRPANGSTLFSAVDTVISNRYDYFSFNEDPWSTIEEVYGLIGNSFMLKAYVSNVNSSNIPLQKNKQTNKEFLGYNIYRDGLKINDEIVISTTYEDIGQDWNNKICYEVTEVRSDCESDPSNEACVTNLGTENLKNRKIKIYPNPANDFIILESIKPIQSISIYNPLGKNMYYNSEIRSDKQAIDIGYFKSGLYFIEIKTLSGIVKAKIIIQ